MSSNKYIKYEEWDNFWCFKPKEEPKLEILEDFNNSSWKPPKGGLIIIIESNREANEPTDKQLESLHAVKANQNEIIESIYSFHQKIVFPLYDASIDIEEDQIISNQAKTNIVYSIKSVQIPHLSNEESNYFILNFHFNYDDEHDMSFLFKNLSVRFCWIRQ